MNKAQAQTIKILLEVINEAKDEEKGDKFFGLKCYLLCLIDGFSVDGLES